MTVGFVEHDASLAHEMPRGHPERPERIGAVAAHLEASGLAGTLEHHNPEPASDELLGLVHDADMLGLLARLQAAGGGRIDLDTAVGPRSFEAARRGSQGAVDAAAAVLDGRWTSAFVCTRPPGHHATTHRSMGFCLTNHVAVAARWAVGTGRARRVAIVDWDAHHGNGTQDVFWTDPDVLYVSLHQYPWYPGTGDASERGAGEGAGTTVNVPLPAGAAEDAYTAAFEMLVEPAVRSFAPDLVLVSAGYDAHHRDPLCMMRLTAGAFARLTARVIELGPGPVCVLEGGYDLEGLAWSAGATIATLVGRPPAVPEEEVTATAGVPEAMAWVERAVALRSSP